MGDPVEGDVTPEAWTAMQVKNEMAQALTQKLPDAEREPETWGKAKAIILDPTVDTQYERLVKLCRLVYMGDEETEDSAILSNILEKDFNFDNPASAASFILTQVYRHFGLRTDSPEILERDANTSDNARKEMFDNRYAAKARKRLFLADDELCDFI